MVNQMLKIRSMQLVCLISVPAFVIAFPSYISKIPNGASIPNPCGSGTWNAVGHVTDGGGGLNQFGKDFQTAGNTWTKALCGMDSDGDGKTNGEELGDPKCAWTEGNSPSTTSGITNPAVCEPVGSNLCGTVCEAVTTLTTTTVGTNSVTTTTTTSGTTTTTSGTSPGTTSGTTTGTPSGITTTTSGTSTGATTGTTTGTAATSVVTTTATTIGTVITTTTTPITSPTGGNSSAGNAATSILPSVPAFLTAIFFLIGFL